jgi:hypothetical protein
VEIIFELLFNLFGYALQFLFEIFAQAIFELVAELGVRCISEPFRRPEPSSPIMAAIGYLIYGAVAGGLSLLLPKMFAVPSPLRLANLIITPIACGYVMALVGRFRERRGDQPIRLDTFAYGYLFAVSMAAVRFVWR